MVVISALGLSAPELPTISVLASKQPRHPTLPNMPATSVAWWAAAALLLVLLLAPHPVCASEDVRIALSGRSLLQSSGTTSAAAQAIAQAVASGNTAAAAAAIANASAAGDSQAIAQATSIAAASGQGQALAQAAAQATSSGGNATVRGADGELGAGQELGRGRGGGAGSPDCGGMKQGEGRVGNRASASSSKQPAALHESPASARRSVKRCLSKGVGEHWLQHALAHTEMSWCKERRTADWVPAATSASAAAAAAGTHCGQRSLHQAARARACRSCRGLPPSRLPSASWELPAGLMMKPPLPASNSHTSPVLHQLLHRCRPSPKRSVPARARR